MERQRPLTDYVNSLAAAHFSQGVPSAADVPGAEWSGWQEGARVGAREDTRQNKAQTERERELQRKGRIWLLCAGAAIAAYVRFSGGSRWRRLYQQGRYVL